METRERQPKICEGVGNSWWVGDPRQVQHTAHNQDSCKFSKSVIVAPQLSKDHVQFSRVWAMPNSDTFSVKPIGDFVRRYLSASNVSVDPFARNKQWATYTNDLNPDTTAKCHMDAEQFLRSLAADGVRADLIIFDPPYSPRQISECYKSVGIEVGMKQTQSALLYQRVRDAIVPLCTDDAVVLSFGWNSVGMGKRHAFEQIEIMLCCHGGARNDTICLAERRVPNCQNMLF